MPDRKPQPDSPATDSRVERAMLLRDAVEHPTLGTMTMNMLGSPSTIMVNGRLTFFIAGM